MIGHVTAFLEMTKNALPDLYQTLSADDTILEPEGAAALKDLYASIRPSNFSKEVLASRPGDLSVMKLSDVGWTDLGDPGRVKSAFERWSLELRDAHKRFWTNGKIEQQLEFPR